MIQVQGEGRLTEVSGQAPKIYIVSAQSEELVEAIHTYSPSAGQWRLTTFDHPEALLQGPAEEPDIVVVESHADLEVVKLLLARARPGWPNTQFILYSPQEIHGAQELNEIHGEMPMLQNATLHELAELIESEASAMSFGLLRGLTLPDLLQTMQRERKTGVILAHSASSWGRLRLLRGELVEAYVHGTLQTGEVAVLEILSWEKVTLRLDRTDHNQHQRPSQSLPDLLPDVETRKKEGAKPDDPDLSVLPPGEDSKEETVLRRNAVPTDVENLQDSHVLDSWLLDLPPIDFPSLLLQAQQPALDAQTPPVLSHRPPEHQSPTEVRPMENVKSILESALSTIEGAMAVALVDYGSGMAMGTAGTGINLEVAAAGNTEVVKAKLRTMESLGLQDSIEDIMITLDTQYHIIYLVPGKTLFMYLVLSKSRANLAMARYKLKTLGTELKI